MTAGAALTVLAVAIWSITAHPWGWLFAFGVHPYPASSSTPWTYQMWSGIVPALTVISLFTALGGAWHLHNCHYATCWRLGKHRIGGTPWCGLHTGYAKRETADSDRLDKIVSLLEVASIGRNAQ